MDTSHWTLHGKKALITGGTRGIGAATVRAFLQLGAEVCFVSRSQSEIEERELDWTSFGAVHGVVADVSQPEGISRLKQHITQTWGHLDILVNNVGTNIRKRALAYTLEEYHHIMNTNLRSVYFLSQQMHPLLRQTSAPAIINVSSVAAQTHLRTGAIYGMSKAAMEQLTRNLAVEWAEDKIRVNAVAPWYIKTPLAEQVLSNIDYYNEVISRTPLKKIGKPENVADTIAFLCMPASAYITGQCLSVDGGFSIYGF
ncbi:MAG: SDR family oxidoreductase [Bacteroidales bacterium]